jgi:hypothetical protein
VFGCAFDCHRIMLDGAGWGVLLRVCFCRSLGLFN